MNGISAEDKRERRHLLTENMVQIVDSMKSSGIANPVGIVVDATDRMGSVMCRSAMKRSGIKEEEAVQRLKDITTEMARQGKFPTLTLVVSWEMASRLLPLCSPTAKKSLFEMKSKYQVGTGSRYLVVGIGSGGNTYGVAEIPDMPRPAYVVHDGQHVHRGIHLPAQLLNHEK